MEDFFGQKKGQSVKSFRTPPFLVDVPSFSTVDSELGHGVLVAIRWAMRVGVHLLKSVLAAAETARWRENWESNWGISFMVFRVRN